MRYAQGYEGDHVLATFGAELSTRAIGQSLSLGPTTEIPSPLHWKRYLAFPPPDWKMSWSKDARGLLRRFALFTYSAARLSLRGGAGRRKTRISLKRCRSAAPVAHVAPRRTRSPAASAYTVAAAPNAGPRSSHSPVAHIASSVKMSPVTIFPIVTIILSWPITL
jgi:hypothetical protein